MDLLKSETDGGDRRPAISALCRIVDLTNKLEVY